MSSFHFLPTEKLTWEIHVALWNDAGVIPYLWRGLYINGQIDVNTIKSV